MAVKEDWLLATTKTYPHKSDIESSSSTTFTGKNTDYSWPLPPTYHPPPPRSTSKFFVYIFAIFVLLSVLLFIFSLVVFKTKHLDINITSVQLTSLRLDTSLPSFYAAMSAQIRLNNPNFGPMEINSVNISIVYGNNNNDDDSAGPSFVGGGEMKPADKWRIGARKGEVTGRRVAVEAVSEKAELLRSSEGDGGDGGMERERLRRQLSSGVLELNWRVKVIGEVTLFKRIRRPAEGWDECLISIDLRSGRVNKVLC